MRAGWTRLGSFLWSSASALARSFARRGWRRVERAQCRVVSVGNLQAGGAGKTPLVALIAREAIERGLRTCILSRGYQGQWEQAGGVLAPGAERVDPRLSGDEPALLQQALPQAWLGIGKDRFAQLVRVEALAGAPMDLVILDDGLQHLRIQRDLDVVALTSRGRSEVLHRDWPSAVSPESLTVWTKGDTQPDLGPGLRRAPDVRIALEARVILGNRDPSRPLCLVTGVADGEAVRRSVDRAGYNVARHIELPDHAAPDGARAEALEREAERNGWRLAMTGKDWVKWRELQAPEPGRPRSEVLVFEPEVVFLSGREVWCRKLWGT